MTRRSAASIAAAAAVAILLLSAPAHVAAQASASASRSVKDGDKVQSVKEQLVGAVPSGGLMDTLGGLKDRVLGASIDTQAAKDALTAKLQPTLLESVRQKLTGHPTSAERIQGAIQDVATERGIDVATLQSYANKWGLTVDNLSSKTDDIKQALLAKTEPTLLEKVRQRLTGHPTSAERVQGAINDVATEYGVDPQSLKSRAEAWGISYENLASKSDDIKATLLSKLEPTLAEKLQQRLTGHPTNAERASGALKDLAAEYGIHADSLSDLASQYKIQLPEGYDTDALSAKVEQVTGTSTGRMWDVLRHPLSGTKAGELLEGLSPEEREKKLRQTHISSKAHDALDEALSKLFTSQSGEGVEQVDVNIQERGQTLGERLASFADKFRGGADLEDYKSKILSGSFSKDDLLKATNASPTLRENLQRAVTGHPTDAERAQGAAQDTASSLGVDELVEKYYSSIKGSSFSDKLSDLRTKILGGSYSKDDLEKAAGADPTLIEKIQRALTGHPTDAERLQGAASSAVGNSGVKDTVSAYYEAAKSNRLTDKLAEYRDKISSGSLSKSELEKAAGADPTLYEKVKFALTGHPTDAERAQGAATNLADKAGISDTISKYYDAVKSNSLKDKLDEYRSKISSGSLSKEELEKAAGADPTLFEKLRFAVTGHPTDAERLQGAATNALDSAGIKDLASRYYDAVKTKALGAKADAESLAAPTLLEKVQRALTGHPTDAERLQGAAKNKAQEYGLDNAADATVEKMKGAAVNARVKAGEYLSSAQAEAEPSLLEKIQQKLTGHPTDAERAQGAAQNLADKTGLSDTLHKASDKASELTANAKAQVGGEPSLTDRIKAGLGFREPTLAEKLQAAAADLQTKAKSYVSSNPSASEKLQAAATDLQTRAKTVLGVEPATWQDKLSNTITDLQERAKAALSSNDASTAQQLQDTIASLTSQAKEKVGLQQPKEKSLGEKLSDKVSGIFSSSDTVTIDKSKLQEAEAKIKEARRSAVA